MGRPKEDKILKRNKQIIGRFTEIEYENILRNAEHANMSLSAYLRELVLNGKVEIC